MKTIKDLKEMMAAPADKSFFKKYGMPKAITEHKARKQALEVKKK